MIAKQGIIIGLGGMGLRHLKVLKSLNFKIVGVCDQNPDKLKKIKLLKCVKHVDYKKFLNMNADIVCISSNTSSRFNIIKEFLLKSRIKRILIEKPLATTYSECLKINNLVKKSKKKVFVNTFRTISPNYKKIKKLFKDRNEKVTHVSIIAPSAGLGNMGSIFFDISNFFISSRAITVSCQIDKTGTENPRGKKFKDPGGYGVVKYHDNSKVFFDLSENTSLPYKIILKSKNTEITIDEINKNFFMHEKPKNIRHKPDYFYLYKPLVKKLKKMQKYDVVNLTKLSVNKLFSLNFKNNLLNSLNSMKIVFGCHASKLISNTVKLPLKKNYHGIKINFP